MSAFNLSGKSIVTSPVLAGSMYAGLVAALVFVAVSSIADILAQRQDVASVSTMLEQLEGRRPTARQGGAADVARPSGSPFLEGETITVAGATLLQRVADSVMKFGGSVLSTQLDVQGGKSRSGLLSMVASCEVDQPALQQIIYDLEVGMPFLFVDQLVIQSSRAASETDNGRMRVLLAISGQWRGDK